MWRDPAAAEPDGGSRGGLAPSYPRLHGSGRPHLTPYRPSRTRQVFPCRRKRVVVGFTAPLRADRRPLRDLAFAVILEHLDRAGFMSPLAAGRPWSCPRHAGRRSQQLNPQSAPLGAVPGRRVSTTGG